MIAIKRDDYLIQFDEVKTGTIDKLLKTIQSKDGKLLNELKVKDLSYHNSDPIFPGTGIYIFREGEKVVYVGKNSSMSFTERLAKHFDLRHGAWFNRLLELVCTKILQLDWNDQNALAASKYAFENLNIVLINFKDRSRVDRIERLLRSCAEPLNKFKSLRENNLEKIVDTY
jgi:hypothetical protein